jgi:DNA-binding CsgD family transcriptional regulator
VVEEVIGRDAELEALESFVGGLGAGASAVVLEGDDGIGKTTLWRVCVEQAKAREVRVLAARPAESETALSFAGIRDLLDASRDEALAALPAPQRRALSCALLVDEDDGPPPDAHAIGVALLTALRGLSAVRPLLIAVDDVHWLDAESTAGLVFACRRLGDAPVGLLLARRSGLETGLAAELARALPPDRHRALVLGPLGAEALGEVIRQRLDVALPPPLLAEVHGAAGGNPFFALEIVRTLRRRDTFVEAGRPLPVPDSFLELVHGRLRDLPAESRHYLLGAAAHPYPTVQLVEAATGIDRGSGLEPAIEAGIVGLEGDRIRFTHPLLAAGAYELAEPESRAQLHARLAELSDDAETRGRHLALSVDEPDRAVAAALDSAAEQALARGAPRAAALLLERARELTPADDSTFAGRRALDAAAAHHEAGDTRRARALLEAELERPSAGPARAAVLVELARVRSYDDDLRGAAALYERAAVEAEPGSAVKASARQGLSATLFGLRERLDEAAELAKQAAEASELHGASHSAAEALGTAALCEAALGRPSAAATAAQAFALQPLCGDRLVVRQPCFAVAIVRFWHGDVLGARRAFEDMTAVAAEMGDESSIPYLRLMLAQIDCALGRFDDAIAEAEAGRTIAEHASLLGVRAVAEAHLGRVDDATSSGTRALELAGSTSGVPAWILASSALGHLALAQGDPSAALTRLEPVLDHHRREGIEEPGALPFMPDCIDAFVEAGRLPDAEEGLERYEVVAQRLGRLRALASARRCRGVLAGAAGDLGTAIQELETAAELAAAEEMPYERARALLALGAALRRGKRRREAREMLEQAVAAFEGLGARLWSDRTDAELRRISGRAPTEGALTPAEARIAKLVAEGRTNREVAAALFLSERTVEGHLSRVFGKLGVRSRTELARVLASPNQGVALSNPGDSPVSANPPAP